MKLTIKLSLLGALTVVLATLKFVGVLDWGWWFVFLPTILVFAGIVLVIFTVFVISALEVFFEDRGID